MNTPAESLLQVEGLSVVFDDAKPTAHRALDGLNLSVGASEIVGLVGESGSGKTVLAHSILGLLPSNGRITTGRVVWRGHELQRLPDEKLRPIRGTEIAMIFQDPQASMNPVFRAGRQVEWVLKLHRDLIGPQAKTEVLRLFTAVHLRDPERCYSSYPHQLSGGMAQRVMIAMALACRPKLLIADEPTSALDVTTQAEILQLLSEIRKEFGMALLFISHDTRAVSAICDKVAVMFHGSIVETGDTERVFSKPDHPYTRRLIDSAAGRITSAESPSNSPSNNPNPYSAATQFEELPCQQ